MICNFIYCDGVSMTGDTRAYMPIDTRASMPSDTSISIARNPMVRNMCISPQYHVSHFSKVCYLYFIPYPFVLKSQ